MTINFLGIDWQEIRTKLVPFLANSFADENTIGLYYPDGSPTHEVLDKLNPDQLNGPSIVSINYPEGGSGDTSIAADYASQRNVELVVEQDRAEVGSELIEYEETIRNVGTCGPKWTSQCIANGYPRSYVDYPVTPKTIIQHGRSLGFDAYYAFSGYQLLPIEFEHQEQRVEGPGKPLHFGDAFIYYPYYWQRVYETILPSIWYPL